MRLNEHPILQFERGKRITFTFNELEVEAHQGETIAAALHAAGIRKLSESQKKHRARGLFCAIGNCSSCFMKVDGIPNVKTCVTRVEEGMRVEEQRGKGDLNEIY